MAAYTSVQSGAWDDASTWGAGGGYPGDGTSGDGDTFTVAGGHVVTVGMDGTAGSLGAGTVYGTLRYEEGAGTHRLRVAGASTLTVASGGTLRMDGGAAGAVQVLELHSSSDGGCGLSVSSGGALYLAGRQKTVMTLTAGAIGGGAGVLAVSDDTGWEPGDAVALIRRRTQSEVVTLSSDCGGGVWLLSGTVSEAYPSGCAAWNLTRSVRIVGSSTEHDGTMALQSGSTATSCAYAEYMHLDEVRLQSPARVTGCVARDMEGSEIGFYNLAAGSVFCDCVAYSAQAAWGHYQSAADARYVRCGVYCGGQSGMGIRLGAGGAHLDGCQVVAHHGLYVEHPFECVDSHVWGCQYAVSMARQGQFVDCVLGRDPGGNAAPNTTQFYSTRGPVLLDRCLLEDDGSPGVVVPQSVVRSLNHDRTSGLCREWQLRGSCESDSANGRGGTGYCDKVDPSSADEPFLYFISFPCAAGAMPTLRFYAKGTAGLGGLVARLGRHRCGLSGVRHGWGSLDAEGRFSVGAEYSQLTVGFEGATDCAGQVEVCIEVYDGGGGLLYLDDFSVSGND